ncbi:MAG TPA: VOC family protein [Gaiellaceae bacterium]|nr:VOC family protein [Gaiellaceae bacterium]
MRRFVELAVFTDDVPAVTSFYARVLGVVPEAEWPGGAIFAIEGGKLLVHERGDGVGEHEPPNEDHVAIGVTDLVTACDTLRTAGVEVLVEPRDYPWGRSAYLRDPDGRLVELTEG